MDYQIVQKFQNQHFMFVISFLIFSFLPYCLCIVNRDLVLTPKQGLQLSGKRIFYEESLNNEKNTINNQTDSAGATVGTQPWEHTLKHVTYLTLFTNAANGIITGNFSKVKEYNDFLTSPYLHTSEPIDSRFGDVVTLAQGRLEAMSNGSYRFIEGNCDYECAREANIVAIWHIQKIRHRDSVDRKYHYEMKFSVRPMTVEPPKEIIVRGGPNKRTIKEERHNVQTYIQKQDDYPQSFNKIVTDKDENFLGRRYDSARNFRQVSPHQLTQQVTPIPQSTFLRGVYHHPTQLQRPNMPRLQHSVHTYSQPQLSHHHRPQQLPLPERLNTGELYKDNYISKSPTKIELFPNLLNMFMGKTHSLPPPTTFRPPNYHMKFSRPEIYVLQQQHQSQEFPKFSEYQQLPTTKSQELFNQATISPVPIVTHHYHHHFFMPNNSAITIEQSIQHNSEQYQHPPPELYHTEVTEMAAPQGYATNFNEEPSHTTTTTLKQNHFPFVQQNYQNLNENYHSNYHIQQLMPPAPQKFVFPNTQIEQQNLMHVTPAPPLKIPQQSQEQQHYENRPFISSLEYTTVHIPLLISYPASTNDENMDGIPTTRNKPFLQSDPIAEPIQYSEPDPLYANIHVEDNKNENKLLYNGQYAQEDGSQEPQLESPDQFDLLPGKQQQNTEEADNKEEHSESIGAQLPAPYYNTVGGTEEVNNFSSTKHNITEQTTSESANLVKVSNDKTTPKFNNTEPNTTTTAATKLPKIFPMRNKRISLKTGTTTSTSTTSKPTTSSHFPSKPIGSKTRKPFLSTSSTGSALKTISRYRNSYTRNSSISSTTTSTTTTEKPILKWFPKRKSINGNFMPIRNTVTPVNENKEVEIDESYEIDDNDENEDFKGNESNNLKRTKPTMSPTTKDDFIMETTTEILNDITTSISSTLPATQSPSPLLSETTQLETDIYEVLTQKSVSKSVSLKVGNNGEEIPIIVDDEENEVKNV